jgi:hypothetical protein
MKDPDEDDEAEPAGPSPAQDNMPMGTVTVPAERPAKRRRIVTRPKQLHKKVFDAAPAKLMDRPPSSGKATVPFKTMVHQEKPYGYL